MNRLTAEQAYASLAALLMAASGMWPHCHPAPVVQEALAQPEFASMRFDFKSLVREHTAALLLGVTAVAALGRTCQGAQGGAHGRV